MLALLAQCFTGWSPSETPPNSAPQSEQAAQIAHRASLERRWKSGQAMNAKQILEATGGVLTAGALPNGPPPPMGGIGPFPGIHQLTGR